jgi:hypothetical protein
MAFTNANLFVTFNAFLDDTWQRAVVFRFPLATLASGASLGYRWWSTTDNGSIRLCRGPGAVMYMGSHNSVSQLRVFQWADTATTIAMSNVNVRPWTAGAYSAPGPGGVNWLGRLDSRITGAWVGGGNIGFMWSANRDATHPLPYIRVVRIKASTKALVDEPGHLEPHIGMGLSRGCSELAGCGRDQRLLRRRFASSGSCRRRQECDRLGHAAVEDQHPWTAPDKPGVITCPASPTMRTGLSGWHRAIPFRAVPHARTSSRATSDSATERSTVHAGWFKGLLSRGRCLRLSSIGATSRVFDTMWDGVAAGVCSARTHLGASETQGAARCLLCCPGCQSASCCIARPHFVGGARDCRDVLQMAQLPARGCWLPGYLVCARRRGGRDRQDDRHPAGGGRHPLRGL